MRRKAARNPRQLYVNYLSTDELVRALEAAQEKVEGEAGAPWPVIFQDLLDELTHRTVIQSDRSCCHE